MENEDYDFVTDDDVVEDGINNNNTMLQILYWIGFRTPNQRDTLVEDAFESFNDIRTLTEKDITTMSTDFSGRTQVNGRINFGTRRTKKLKSLVHWVQDFYRVSEEPGIVGLSENIFKSQLERALIRSDIRKSMALQTKTAADAASPGPLESEKQWKQWEEKFCNYARTHIGTNGIPLSYIIRENEEPDRVTEHPDFISRTIACAPHEGEYYLADRMSVFNMLVSFTTGQPSGDWIKSTLRYSDGRRSMNALRTHFAGEGNATRNMAEADRMYESLQYKSERAMSFEMFLTQCQKMFNIYEKEGEPMTEEAKVRFLFKKVQHAGLRSSIDALKATQTTGSEITYTMSANHLSTAVSELPEFLAKQSRMISGLASGGGDNDNDATKADGNGIYKADGSINTGHIPSWRSLSIQERKQVMAERKRLGIQYKRKGGAGRGTGNRNKAAVDANRTKQLEQQNLIYKRKIKALRRIGQADGGTEVENVDIDDAGDQFGGKASKKKLKARFEN